MQSLSSISRTSPIGSQGFISVSDSIHQPDLVLAHLVGAAQGYEQVILASEIQACPGYSLIIDQAEFLGLGQNQLAIQSPAHKSSGHDDENQQKNIYRHDIAQRSWHHKFEKPPISIKIYYYPLNKLTVKSIGEAYLIS